MSGQDHENTGDEELARRARAGSLSAFETIATRYQDRIYAFLLRRLSNTHDAEDLTQDVFVRAYRKLHRYDSRYPFRTWLFTIARRTVISFYRRRRHTQELPDALTDRRDPSRALAATETTTRIWHLARRALSENQFTAIDLRVREGMSVREIATTMEKSGTHVKVLLFRARKNLVHVLDRDKEAVSALREQAGQAQPISIIEMAAADLN